MSCDHYPAYGAGWEHPGTGHSTHASQIVAFAISIAMLTNFVAVTYSPKSLLMMTGHIARQGIKFLGRNMVECARVAVG